jgi:thymidylate synthase
MSRLFADFPEAQNEITRDLAELGTDVWTETMQDKDIKGDPDFMTKELTNYTYTVLKPNYEEIEGTHDEWIQQEWEDRLVGELNPGRSWQLRREVWDQFREKQNKPGFEGFGIFSYTYSERMGGKHLDKLIDELLRHPHSRQLWLPVWYTKDEDRRGERRVPCSLGYWFVQRDGALHETYVMRSCDFYTHYANDVALATMLLHYVASQTDFKVGTFTHFLGSLHVYAKDVAHVF